MEMIMKLIAPDIDLKHIILTIAVIQMQSLETGNINYYLLKL